jgi:hypothetical protein
MSSSDTRDDDRAARSAIEVRHASVIGGRDLTGRLAELSAITAEQPAHEQPQA